jgi:8-oxo-dGTP diphosphatase
MEAKGEPARDLMDDVKAVAWLPLDAAVERLSRSHERAFLANVGPLALQAVVAGAAVTRPEFPDGQILRANMDRRRTLMQRVRDWLRPAA